MIAKYLFNVILKFVSQSDLHHATTSLKTTACDAPLVGPGVLDRVSLVIPCSAIW
jgi:hypothetical protein